MPRYLPIGGSWLSHMTAGAFPGRRRANLAAGRPVTRRGKRQPKAGSGLGWRGS
jgi:hypothetical protein